MFKKFDEVDHRVGPTEATGFYKSVERLVDGCKLAMDKGLTVPINGGMAFKEDGKILLNGMEVTEDKLAEKLKESIYNGMLYSVESNELFSC